MILPQEFPKGLDAQSVEETVTTVKKGFEFMFIISIILQFLLKRSLKKIVNMYLVMQMMVYQLTLSVQLPALLDVMLIEFTKLIEF